MAEHDLGPAAHEERPGVLGEAELELHTLV
jgi:hypothetical protein